MELELKRDVYSENSTTGKLYVNGEFSCFTLEDTDRGLMQGMTLEELKQKKVYGKTAIPKGKYEIIISYSEHFGKEMPLLLNVPDYEGVRIHSGNVPADTLGCILVGQARSLDEVIASRMAFIPLWEKIKNATNNNEKIYITIA